MTTVGGEATASSSRAVVAAGLTNFCNVCMFVSNELLLYNTSFFPDALLNRSGIRIPFGLSKGGSKLLECSGHPRGIPNQI